ncbi:hypothetical protein [Nocardia sp. NPDC048505]|uniref:hypothetical protein n=1 Tax=unclassified Nocardia TaxID=2637762 RepID=UPI0033CEDF8E
MKSRLGHRVPRATLAAVAITAAALSAAGTASAAPASVAPIAGSGSSSGSDNVGGTGSSASQLINAAFCTLTGGKWIPVLDICVK